MPNRDDVIRRLEDAQDPRWDIPPTIGGLITDALALLRESWRPMSEAPEDGREIIVEVAATHPSAGKHTIVWRMTYHDRWADALDYSWPTDAFARWRPLPKEEG